ncbi:MAG: 1-(5-phosphoribosyl)-5-((5-phosphoribosylamino)methylideneamino) imidazole-4-carboxamide isomerase [Alphaproteobacteria bacterium ADurb.Bin438]|nr:MAG: 1-(5-phosphoribosyl)-5-((5-phosphoribosylamino)methylideneamino) imidazole-4-carboxamide isomerase [Alphaproteobacteria bacterium ADurb.Bin438]
MYEKDPLKMVQNFVDAGATWLHIVDLDGAKDVSKRQTEILKKIASSYPDLKIEVGGGIRTREDIKSLLDAGVSRVIIGSLSANDPELTKEFIKEFGEDKIVLGIDVRIKNGTPYALISGWLEDSDKTLFDLLDFYLEHSKNPTLLCTDISKDGTLQGPSLELYREIKEKYKSVKLIASGGVSNMDDLDELNKIACEYAITGKALYENKIDLKEALERFK